MALHLAPTFLVGSLLAATDRASPDVVFRASGLPYAPAIEARHIRGRGTLRLDPRCGYPEGKLAQGECNSPTGGSNIVICETQRK